MAAAAAASAIRAVLTPKVHTVGASMTVLRHLPALEAGPDRSVGPFIFFDHFESSMTRKQFASGASDVGAHPHIGMATFTFIMEGGAPILHRDSMGTEMVITPGAVNVMVAGRGVVHSERASIPAVSAPHDSRVPRPAGAIEGVPHDDDTLTSRGLQLWLALPADGALNSRTGEPYESRVTESCDPWFSHTPAADIPVLTGSGVDIMVVAGSAFGVRSPASTPTPTLFLATRFQPGGMLGLLDDYPERAVYNASEDGDLTINGEKLEPRTVAVLEPGAEVELRSATGAADVVVFGGDPVPTVSAQEAGEGKEGHRSLYWNFVATDKARIAEARQAWEDLDLDRWGTPPNEEDTSTWLKLR